MPADADDEAEKAAFKEKLRSLRFGKVPGGNRSSKVVIRPKADPAWERGIVTDKRPGGFEMPLLDSEFNPVRLKHYAENRHKIEARREQLRSDPNPQTKD